MPRIKNGTSYGSGSSFGVRIGAGIAVVAAHVAVGSLLFSASETQPQLLSQDAIMVSVIEAPITEQAKGEEITESQEVVIEEAPTPPQPVVEPEPEPAPQPEPEPEPEPVVEPEPEPLPEPEPEPEPEPIVEPVVEPTPAPKPKPKPEPPKPKPVPKPTPKPAPKPTPKPTPPPAAKPAAKPAEAADPAKISGTPDGAARNQAPQTGPQSNEPVMLSSVEYRGQRPMPVYPRMSQRLREEGTTIVLVDIDTQGEVVRATISKSSGFERLDEAALVAARKARFTPARVGGVARNARANLPFNFVLRN